MAVAPYAAILGAQASQVGLSMAEIAAMTALNFAGGSEFAAIRLWSAVPPVLMIVMVTFLINSRHIVMGAALAPHLRQRPLRSVLPALFFMADEGWALSQADIQKRRASGHAQPFSWPYYWGACVPFYPVWVGSAVLGATVGPVLADLDRYGFAMAFPAVFLVLIRGMWRGLSFARPWLVSGVVAATVFVAVPGGWFVIAGSVAGLVSAFFWTDESQ